MPRPTPRPPPPLLWGALCHVLFAVAVAGMLGGLATGLRTGTGRLSGSAAVVADLALLGSFPIAHSVLLTTRGRRALRAAAGAPAALDTTLFAAASSALLLAVFGLWSPLPGPQMALTGAAATFTWATFGLGWLLLGVAMAEAGLGVQTGAAGWMAARRGTPVRYPPPAKRGLHGLVPHPIYLSFVLILWSGPVWTLDKLLMASTWTVYCAVGSGWKARRQAQRARPVALPMSRSLGHP